MAELDELFKLLQTSDAPPEGQPITSPSQVSPQEVTKTVAPLPADPALAMSAPITEPRELESISRETTNLAGQDIAKGMGNLDTADQLKAEGISGLADVEEAAGQDKAALVDEYVMELDQYEVDAGNKLREADEDVRVLAGREPDPSRFWNNADTMTKVLYSIAALVQSVNKPDEVPMATKALNDMIARDISMQTDRMGREIDAAKGRARTARELIQMGGDKDAVVYKEKQARIASLAAAAAARSQAKVQTAESLQESSKLRGVLLAAARENRREYEAALVKTAQAQAQAFRLGGGGGGGRSSGGGGAMAAGPDGVKPDMIIPGLTGAYGVMGNGVKINKMTSGISSKAFGDLAVAGSSYQAAQGELATGLEIAQRVKDAGGDYGALQKDPDWQAWLRQVRPTIAKANGHIGALTQADAESGTTGMGGNVLSADGFVASLAEAQATPDRAIARILAYSENSATRFKDGIVARIDPEFIPPKMGAVSAMGIYEGRKRQRETAQAAEREELIGGAFDPQTGKRITGGLATPSSGAQEALNVLPIVGGKDALSQTYASVYRDARTPKERDKALDLLRESARRVEAEIASDPKNIGARLRLTRLQGMISELSGISGKDTVKAKDRRQYEKEQTEAELDSAKYDYGNY